MTASDFKLNDATSSFLQDSRAVKLTAKEQAICDYIADHSSEIIHMSITEVAEQCKTSEASLVRFSKKLGYKGFQALKIRVAQDSVEPKLQFHEEIGYDDNMSSIAQKVFQSYAQTLNDTLSVLDFKKLEQAAETITNARRVIFLAIGGSEKVAEDAVNKFLRVGIMAYAYADTNMQRMTASLTTPEDVVIAISHSGATVATIESLALAKKNGAKSIVITNYSRSPILQYADISLFTSSRETRYKVESLSSRIAQLTILDTLVTAISNSDNKRYYENLLKTRSALDNTKI